jgi:diaphanous 1
VLQGANSLVSGLSQIENEVEVLKRMPDPPPGDRFVSSMEVFAGKAQPAIAALRSMVDRLERDLRALLAYFGESPTGEPKPEELFSTVVSFAGALIVSSSKAVVVVGQSGC